jgi:hypothetical protein
MRKTLGLLILVGWGDLRITRARTFPVDVVVMRSALRPGKPPYFFSFFGPGLGLAERERNSVALGHCEQ